MLDNKTHGTVIWFSLFSAALIGFAFLGLCVFLLTSFGVMTDEFPLNMLVIFCVPILILGLPIAIGVYLTGRKALGKEVETCETCGRETLDSVMWKIK